MEKDGDMVKIGIPNKQIDQLDTVINFAAEIEILRWTDGQTNRECTVSISYQK